MSAYSSLALWGRDLIAILIFLLCAPVQAAPEVLSGVSADILLRFFQ